MYQKNREANNKKRFYLLVKWKESFFRFLKNEFLIKLKVKLDLNSIKAQNFVRISFHSS
jgi:hypothetical protein